MSSPGIDVLSLLPANPLDGSEVVMVVQTGISKKTTTAAINTAGINTPSYVVLNQDSILANERVLMTTGDVTLVDGGPKTSVTIGLTGNSLALANITGTGLIAQTGANTVATRSLIAPAAGITIANGDGVAGNPTLALSASLLSLQNLTGTGMVMRVAADTLTLRSLTGTTNQITITNPDGISGPPTIAIASNPIIPGTASLTIPIGGTAARPGSPSQGMVRFNSDLLAFEVYNGTSWGPAGGSGTVSSVSVTTANGVSGSVANPTTTPAITLTLGAITPSSVAASGTVTGSNLSGTNTGDQTITLTSDVTGTGTGSFATTVAAIQGTTVAGTTGTGNVVFSIEPTLIPAWANNRRGLTISPPTVSAGTGNNFTSLQINKATVSGTAGASNYTGSDIQTISITGNTTNITNINGLSIGGPTLASANSTRYTGLLIGGPTLTSSILAFSNGIELGNLGSSGITSSNAIFINAQSGSTSARAINYNGIFIVDGAGNVTGNNLSGTNTGDQTITLTGNVTGSGTGSFATTIANSAVTYAKIQNMTAATLLGNPTGSAAAPSEITLGSGLSFVGSVLTVTAGGTGTVTSVSVVNTNGFDGTVATSTTTPAITIKTTVTGLLKGNGTAISAAASGTDYSAGTSGLITGILKSTTTTGALTIAVAADFPTLNQNTTGSAATLTTGRTISITGDLAYTSPSFDGSGNVTAAGTLATVNSNVGTFGSSTAIPVITVNAKGLGTAYTTAAVIAPAGTLSGTTLNSTVVTSSLTSLGSQAQALNMNSHLINNVTDPASPQDAATKNYVDNVTAGLTSKASSRMATTANLTGTYLAGVFTYTATGVQTVDGVTPVLGDRILLKNQTTQSQNGIYNWTTLGAIGVAGVLTRSSDFNSSSNITEGAYTIIEEGTVNAGTLWVETGQGPFTVGTTSIIFTELQVANQTITLTGVVTGTGAGSITTSLGSFSSANLAAALTDETGSGAAVFANTPTLVTPLLGTPTSGALTNCTGLPISSGVSGLATGIATFLATPSSANLIAAVTDETGSGALVFATSPTLVTPALGTPVSGVMTNVTGTASALTSGITNALASATTTVNVSSATAPTNGQVLTATSGTAATWQTPTGGSSAFSALTSGTNTTAAMVVGTGASLAVSGTGTIAATTVLNATFTTALTVNTGTLTLTANAANTSVLTIGAGAVSISGSNTGDQTITLTGAVTGTGTGSFATTIATPGTLTVSSTNSTATAHTHAITSSSAPGATASILATDSSGIIGSTGTRIVKGWFTDVTVTNAISGSITGNAATVTTNANLTGAITSSGNATSLGSFSSAALLAALTDETGTGANVFATSPTLVTPLLGTPTSGTLTNCTGLPTTGLTGQVTLAQLPNIASNTVLANVTGGSAVPTAATVTAIIDTIGSTQGNILYRNATNWVILAPGTSGQLLSTGGAAANPSWITASGTGTVTSVATNSTLTGGTITTSGTLSLNLGNANTWTGVQTMQGAILNTSSSMDNTCTTQAYRPTNIQTGTSYTLVLADGGQMVTFNNASAIALTIPANSSVAFPVGTEIDLLQLGAGQVTVSITTDTLNSYTAKVKLAGQYAGATLKKIGTTSWVLIGNLA